MRYALVPAALIADVQMAAEGGGATGLNVTHRFCSVQGPTQYSGTVVFPMAAKDLRELKRRGLIGAATSDRAEHALMSLTVPLDVKAGRTYPMGF